MVEHPSKASEETRRGAIGVILISIVPVQFSCAEVVLNVTEKARFGMLGVPEITPVEESSVSPAGRGVVLMICVGCKPGNVGAILALIPASNTGLG